MLLALRFADTIKMLKFTRVINKKIIHTMNLFSHLTHKCLFTMSTINTIVCIIIYK